MPTLTGEPSLPLTQTPASQCPLSKPSQELLRCFSEVQLQAPSAHGLAKLRTPAGRHGPSGLSLQLPHACTHWVSPNLSSHSPLVQTLPLHPQEGRGPPSDRPGVKGAPTPLGLNWACVNPFAKCQAQTMVPLGSNSVQVP